MALMRSRSSGVHLMSRRTSLRTGASARWDMAVCTLTPVQVSRNEHVAIHIGDSIDNARRGWHTFYGREYGSQVGVFRSGLITTSSGRLSVPPSISMRQPYFPVFKSIIDSTLWSCQGDTIKVFLTLCAKADYEGFVSATADGIRRTADMTLADTERHLRLLESPDVGSKDRERDPGRDGRRIVKVVGGWQVLNMEWYRDEARKQAELYRKRKWWNEKGSDARRDARPIETETETETEIQKQEEEISSSPPAASVDTPAARADSLPVVREVFEEWRVVHSHPTAKLDAKRTARIRGALKLHTPDQLKQAIRGALKDDWLMGRDPKSTKKYDGLETILRDAAQIEKMIDLESGKVNPSGISRINSRKLHQPDHGKTGWE